jgi:hypothetical protein
MEHPHEPLNAIQEWQNWYKRHRVVATLDEPLVSKASRENMHDTSNAVDLWLKDYTEHAKKQASDHFADTIVEAAATLSADEIYDCLMKAVQENYDHAEKEFNNASRLLELIKNNVN